jgi:hypothetical protein
MYTYIYIHTHTYIYKDQENWITGPPMEELEKIPKELKGSATL